MAAAAEQSGPLDRVHEAEFSAPGDASSRAEADPHPPQTSSVRQEEQAHPTVATPSQAPESQQDIAVILQSLCHLHRWTRTASDLHVFERADRLRSVRLGIAIAHARLSEAKPHLVIPPPITDSKQEDSIEDLIGNLSLEGHKTTVLEHGWPFSISSTNRRLKLASILNAQSPVAFAHGDEYVRKLLAYLSDVTAKHAAQASEVPEPLSQGDLYLCDRSLDAFEGALGACCEGVDQVCAKGKSGGKRFISIRPPGHHCETVNPMGFCWLNNAAIAAAHAYLHHGIDRVVIFDIDLHHGNGTQEIVWRLNALAHQHLTKAQKTSPRKPSPKKPLSVPSPAPPLQLFYGSLHDVNSYPCEDMDPQLIANASVNISGGGGSQYISNVHLEPYESVDAFHKDLYPAYRDKLFGSATRFLRQTKAQAINTLVIVSAGFDGCEHEYPAMSRHGAKVPTSFFTRFAQDASAFADAEASGRMVALLEGGYSQRALFTGAGSFMAGLVDRQIVPSEVDWWREEDLKKYESLFPAHHVGSEIVKPKASDAQFVAAIDGEAAWFAKTRTLFRKLEEASPDSILPPLVNEPLAQASKVPTGARSSRSRTQTPAVSPKVALRAQPSRKANPTASEVPAVAPFVPVVPEVANEPIQKYPGQRSVDELAPLSTTSQLSGQPSAAKAPASFPAFRLTFKRGEEEMRRRTEEAQRTAQGSAS